MSGRSANRAAFAALSLVIAGAAIPAAAAQPRATITVAALRPGDKVVVTGSKLRCGVSASSPRTIVCAIATGTDVLKPNALTYAIAATDARVALLRSTTQQTPELVHVESEPPVKGALFPLPPRRAAATVRVGDGTTALVVGGTHVFCLVLHRSDGPAITCGVGPAKSPPPFAIPSYLGVVTQGQGSLAKIRGTNDVVSVVARPQPAG